MTTTALGGAWESGSWPLHGIWKSGSQKSIAWKLLGWGAPLDVPLPRGVKNGDRVRLERRGNIVRRYVNGVRKPDWRIPTALR
jgi:hypothetical protein